MSLAYFDCFAGAAGDMIVASLIDVGADEKVIAAELAKLKLPGLSISTETVQRQGIAATLFTVEAGETDPQHRSLSTILSIIESAGLSPEVTEKSKKIFTRLAQAEAKVHGIDIEEVHFHEVGAADAIADIVCACIALENLGIKSIACSAIPTGSGTVKCAHGLLPVPAPATAELLAGFPSYAGPFQSEATTPTAAAILTALADEFGPIGEMCVSAVGYGAGTREDGPLPNLLRVFLGEPGSEGHVDTIVELSANLDDTTGEVIGATLEALLESGCVDAWASPIVMKKSRPGWTLSVLARPAQVKTAEDILLRSTTTFGLRKHFCQRRKLIRRFETVETAFGPVRVKVGSDAGQDITASPEFADCQSAAVAHNVSAREVLAAAQSAWRISQGPSQNESK